MVLIEIPDNPNCSAVDTRIFHDVSSARPVSQVRLERQPGVAQWYDVTGWTTAGLPCQAVLQKVDDSGDGVAFLLYGGDAGVRLRPAGRGEPWGLTEPEQWGEPFLIVGDTEDVSTAHG